MKDETPHDGPAPSVDLDRRALFRHAATGGLALATGAALAACAHERGGGAPASPSTSAPGAFELEEVAIAELQARMIAGRETARSLVEQYRARIEATNLAGPKLHAVLEVNREAERLADALDAERRAGKLRGPLHGVPVLLKDNIDTAGPLTTTAGSLALEGSIPPAPATVAAKLVEAGAIVLGKTNLSEWANIRSTRSSSGWSARGGQCRNPYVLDRSPSGSSSGSGSAIAASLAAAALGSETDGSIVSPASCCGLVGVKPTVGLVSRAGIIPVALSQDTAGPMTRTVADAAIMLSAIAGPDPRDASTTAPRPGRPEGRVDYSAALDAGALKGARLGVPRKGFFGQSRAMDRVVEAALGELSKLGAVIVDPAELEVPPELGSAELEVLLTELKHQLADYLATLGPGARVHTLGDVITFDRANAEEELAFFGQELFEQAAEKGPLDGKPYLDALELCRSATREKGIDRVMNEHHLDAIVAGTNGPAWLIDLVNGDAYSGGSSTIPAVAGYPHVTVPAGDASGLPVGLSFFGRPFSEAKLLGYAYAFEQATKHRRAPKYLRTIELG